MTTIKFGTDGWRAIIADTYTVENVKRVAQATATWMKNKGWDKAVIGHDCRFGGEMFAQVTTQILGANGIKVHLAKDFVSTPMVSLGVVKTNAQVGIVITASHNPPSYNGFKLKSAYGGPTVPAGIAEVEALIPDTPVTDTLPSLEHLHKEGLLNYIDLEDMYVNHVEENFDMDTIRKSGIKLAFDAMYGAGQRAIQRLLPDCVQLHCEHNPSFMGQAPEPIHRNLAELSATIKNDPTIDCGLANDGDADRIGMYDAEGNFVDSHHILLLLLLYLKKYKKLDGKVVITFSVTDKMKRLCDKFEVDYEVTKIGFKYIAEIMTKETVLVGGEESGGIAAAGHIPERDGIWMGLLILEFMAKTGKSMQALIQEVYDMVGSFAYDRDDLHLTEARKHAIIDQCKSNIFTHFGDNKIRRIETIDGFKFYFNEDEWVMIRPSGTEPVLRVYAQAPTPERVRDLLNATHKTLK